jgi:nucleotide-binding universal stress UspA family protein
MFTSALFTIDGSKTALGAMPALLRAIDPRQTEVTVLEVIDSVPLILAHTTPAGFPMYAGTGVDVDIAEQAIAAQRTEAEDHLAAVASDLSLAGARHVVTTMREGRPGDEIVEFVQERRTELVVMATHGRTGLRRTVLGSVADHVLRHLDDVPLLLVHPSEG